MKLVLVDFRKYAKDGWGLGILFLNKRDTING